MGIIVGIIILFIVLRFIGWGLGVNKKTDR
jgi:hypothetical protein